MGGNNSKQTIHSLNKNISKVILHAAQACGGDINASQNLNISGISGGTVNSISQTQSVIFRADCFSKSQNLANLQSSITQTINNTLKQSSQAVLSALSAGGLKSTTDVHNEVVKNFTSDTVQSILVSVNLAQKLNIENTKNATIQNITQSQIASVVEKGVQRIMNNTRLVSILNSNIKSSGENISKNPISSIVRSLGGALSDVTHALGGSILGPIVAIVCIIVVFSMLGRKSTPAQPEIVEVEPQQQ